MRRLLILFVLISFTTGHADGQIFGKKSSQGTNTGLFSKIGGKKNGTNVKKSNRVNATKRQQEAKAKKKDADYAKFVKKSRQRSIDIQTPEVQIRMKNNLRDSENRIKERKKKTKSSTRKAGQKYK